MKHSFRLFSLFTALILMVFASFILQTQTNCYSKHIRTPMEILPFIGFPLGNTI